MNIIKIYRSTMEHNFQTQEVKRKERKKSNFKVVHEAMVWNMGLASDDEDGLNGI